MLTMDDMAAIVKPHNDKLIAEGRLAEAERQNTALRKTLGEIARLQLVSDDNANRITLHAAIEIAKVGLE
jgi:hypothetical protein